MIQFSLILKVVAVSDEFLEVVKDIPEASVCLDVVVGDKSIEGAQVIFSGSSWEELDPLKVSVAITEFQSQDAVRRNFLLIETRVFKGGARISRRNIIDVGKLNCRR